MLTSVADRPEWSTDSRFTHLADRLANQDALDAAVGQWSQNHDRYELMHQLQSVGVAAGVCQTAEDRVDNDPQLAALQWLTEVPGTKIGTWPVAELSTKLTATPGYSGGKVNRGAPIYGEDNDYVYGDLLGISASEIARLRSDGAI